MDLTSALARLKDIDNVACNESLIVLDAENATDAALTGVYQANVKRYNAIKALFEEFGASDGIEVLGPTGLFREVWSDTFTNLNNWTVYGPGNNRTWGQNGGRTAFYDPSAVAAGDGVTITTIKDPANRTVNGKPAYIAGFITTRGGPIPVLPKFGYYEVAWTCDRVAGFWPAALWLRHAPGGAGTAEVDTMEWFSQYPANIRQAIHLLANAGGIDYNISSKFFGRSQEAPFNTSGATQISGSLIEPDGTDHVKFSQFHNGVMTYSFSTRELATISKPHDIWINTWQGWDIAVCTQTGGAGGDATFTTPQKMRVEYVKVYERV